MNGKYAKTYCPEHPRASKSGHVFTHRLVMERFLGRILDAGEQVHHINENRLDNRIENLQLTTIAEHTSHHFKGKPKTEAERKKDSEVHMGHFVSEETRKKEREAALNMNPAKRAKILEARLRGRTK